VDLPAIFKTVSQFFPDYWLGTLASAAFGAFAGAWINNRIQSKKAIIQELNAVRAALVLCFSIANRFIALKRQHVRPMSERYRQACQEHEKFKDRALTHRGQPPLVYEFHADLQTITPIIAPIQVLERYVFEKISIRHRALAAAVDLVGAIDGLDKSIKYRNDLIAEIRKDSPIQVDKLRERYFGLPNTNGVTDERFKANIGAIYNQTDDCIFFSRILADDLLAYGNRLRRKNSWKYRLGISKLKGADWSIAQGQGLLPTNEAYASWLRGFRTDPTRWQRLIARVRRKQEQ
jgi:hypothetical protein